ncbi:MAG: endonuclease/exonuclease/phosphatase family protein [Kiritimatiellae bacterium]|nr:endonuclease/exonuclease/phosphatase family protein [Kiritimatiellia bacterium]MCO5067278.1 endonuclease/exonuclease/phosphatase family protein [Kiritimatiellia bacterium]
MPETIQIMTFNLRYASGPDGENAWRNPNQTPNRKLVARNLFTAHQPDVVGLQEGEDEQLDELAALLPHLQFIRAKPSGGRGNENAAIAWNPEKMDLLDRGVFALSEKPGPDFADSAGEPFDPYAFFPGLKYPFPRIVIRARFRWRSTGQLFHFYSTHFDLNEDPQTRSAALIVRDAQRRASHPDGAPLAIVCGDFNSAPTDDAWKLFTGSLSRDGARGDFRDSWTDSREPSEDAGTYHDFHGGRPPSRWRIDWILHRGGFAARDAIILYDIAEATNNSTGATRAQLPSDHYPVWARLQFPTD